MSLPTVPVYVIRLRYSYIVHNYADSYDFFVGRYIVMQIPIHKLQKALQPLTFTPGCGTVCV